MSPEDLDAAQTEILQHRYNSAVHMHGVITSMPKVRVLQEAYWEGVVDGVVRCAQALGIELDTPGWTEMGREEIAIPS